MEIKPKLDIYVHKVGWLLNVPLNTLQVILGSIKPVRRRDQTWIPPEPLHHVTVIQL